MYQIKLTLELPNHIIDYLIVECNRKDVSLERKITDIIRNDTIRKIDKLRDCND